MYIVINLLYISGLATLKHYLHLQLWNLIDFFFMSHTCTRQQPEDMRYEMSHSRCRSHSVGQRSRGVGSKSTNKKLAKLIDVNTCIKGHISLDL